MSEYKGISYDKNPDGTWTLVLPSGLTTKAPAQSEEALKAEIDKLETRAQ